MASSLPPNVHISTHPCVQAKLSHLRSSSTNAREVKSLIHEIALLVASDALAKCLTTVSEGAGSDTSPLGYTYSKTTIAPSKISIVPILRSGLAMVDALESLLPHPVPVHHLGLYREKSTLQPVEYYNNLPYHKPSAQAPSTSTPAGTAGDTAGPADLAIVVDPIIATGATAVAAVDTLRDYGVKKVVVISILCSEEGVKRVASCWDGVEVFVGGRDAETDAKGMIKPGLGDVGDRLFLTLGK
jgi:uracil phosphoribosyltransferase